ncbi:MAG: hypothetical protein DWQ47_11590 [Acidobacteria bacterium]|nr:MAG: hypothetical protein DWQ32_14005 [Acidobacteriota bacterium]REJ98218.1 MAG: hypothetical protein DWQ38_16805 [Acidobacteriota bacterium]REK16962.1 MAG: hypothetical protein DWQ43_01850 [Acidobacteriota bacterium]REK42872.1 MAG: hypothetical protein DWQ47_11590 [Acidobacteriota bacterium]
MSEILQYPFFKITNEPFPRLRVTRKIEGDGAEYFGPFLPEPGVRKLLDFLIRRFRFRGCEIRIDGSADLPCPVYFDRRCLAPCDSKICGAEEYAEMIRLLKIFLRNERASFRESLRSRISLASDELDFEKAARWRDLLDDAETIWTRKKWQFWQDDTTDNWSYRDGMLLLVSQRGNRILGGRSVETEPSSASGYVERFYRLHAPARVRIEGFPFDSQSCSQRLESMAGRQVEVEIRKEPTPTALKGLSRLEFALSASAFDRSADHRQIATNLKLELGLQRVPNDILAFDVAHNSGESVVASKVRWKDGDYISAEDEVWHFDGFAEPEAIGKAVSLAVRSRRAPDLIVVDGGLVQLNSAVSGLNGNSRKTNVIAAVKPIGRPREISHFVLPDGSRVDLEDDAAKGLLTTLRNSAHDLANHVHRIVRDTSQLYELARTLPSIPDSQRKEILRTMGSLRKLRNATPEELKEKFGRDTAASILSELSKWKGEQKGQNGRQTEVRGAVIRRLVPIRYDTPGGEAERLQPKNSYRL